MCRRDSANAGTSIAFAGAPRSSLHENVIVLIGAARGGTYLRVGTLHFELLMARVFRRTPICDSIGEDKANDMGLRRNCARERFTQSSEAELRDGK
jgi:hypothetical protein